MKTNVGGIDRAVRILIGVTILTLGFVLKTWLGLIGLVPLMTGLISWCPAYMPLGLSTRSKKRSNPNGW
ncbi:MAG TPA: DUF2892 domain-containing protein [Thermoanaerobaculia bacterium]|nr:DUF2892 domain-containing protein [Thermoanaerobaculia bacterium]HUM31155.1 DUF2892 domain-containing protein [Thermoanaerobaculia bacterium]HXK69511.1 DUF2892 domain-containing protein [Thermoanaerobaculia bacterium]